MSVIPGLSWDINVILAFIFGLFLIYLLGRIFLMPIKIIFHLVYNAIVGGIVLWLLNLVGSHFGFAIAINPITALVVGFLGLPGVVLLILFKIFVG